MASTSDIILTWAEKQSITSALQSPNGAFGILNELDQKIKKERKQKLLTWEYIPVQQPHSTLTLWKAELRLSFRCFDSICESPVALPGWRLAKKVCAELAATWIRENLTRDVLIMEDVDEDPKHHLIDGLGTVDVEAEKVKAKTQVPHNTMQPDDDKPEAISARIGLPDTATSMSESMTHTNELHHLSSITESACPSSIEKLEVNKLMQDDAHPSGSSGITQEMQIPLQNITAQSKNEQAHTLPLEIRGQNRHNEAETPVGLTAQIVTPPRKKQKLNKSTTSVRKEHLPQPSKETYTQEEDYQAVLREYNVNFPEARPYELISTTSKGKYLCAWVVPTVDIFLCRTRHLKGWSTQAKASKKSAQLAVRHLRDNGLLSHA